MSKDPALYISFAENIERVRFLARSDMTAALSDLRPKLRSFVGIRPEIAEVDLDDFLANLAALRRWPEPASVKWDPTLARLVKSSVEDARTSAALLAKGESVFLDSDELDLGNNWIGDLTDFQLRDVRKLLALGHGANFSVPGAGKTRVALAVYSAAKISQGVARLVVVGPKSSFEAWSSESEKVFRDPPRVFIYDGKEIDLRAEIVVINYERLERAKSELSQWMISRPTMMILDEAHRMKLGARGTYGRASLALGPKASRRLILTGTPAPNGVEDLESLMGFTWPGAGRRAVNRAVADGDLRNASSKLRPLYTRTTKSELNLPPQNIVLRRVELPPLHREVYDSLATGMSNRPGTSEDDLVALGKILMYLMMAATSPALLAAGTTRYEPLEYRVPPLHVPDDEPLFDLLQDLPSYETSPKYLEAVDIVRKNASQGRKTLVWSTFVRSLTTLEKLLEPFNPALVHGGTVDRDNQIDRFKSDPNCMVLLSNPATLGEGISLHHVCHDAVYVDRDFAAGRYLQSLDRIHRLGLASNVITNVTILCAEATIDEVINDRLNHKLEFMGKILDDPDVEELGDLMEEPSVAGNMDQEDIRALLGHLHGSSS